jgi:hypothetical protein
LQPVVSYAAAVPPSMASLQELEAQARELRSLSRRLSKEHAKLKRKAASHVDLPAPTQWMRAVAVMVVLLADSGVAAAMEYLRRKGRPCEEACLSEWLSAMTESERQALIHPVEDQHRARRQLAEATKFLSEQNLVSWVQAENKAKSVAPTPGAVLDKAAGSAGPSSSRRSSRYKWLRRVCHRWGGRKCVFGIGDQLSAATFAHKAGDLLLRSRCILGARSWGQKLAPGLGPFLRLSCEGAQMRGRFAISKLGARMWLFFGAGGPPSQALHD